MMKSNLVILVLVALYIITGCQAQPIEPFGSGKETESIGSEENRLWLQAREFDQAIQNQGSIYSDQEATAYLQSIMDRLYPEFPGKVTVRIVKTPVLNAFALPNGSIYMHIGLLARIDNEAQLATILAHEAAHFVQKHGYQQRENVKSSSAVALGVSLAGIPLVGDIIALSSIYGFSRELETEADKVGFQRIRKAGYDTRESVKVFEHLVRELKALDIDEPYFFSSHPKLQNRIDNFKELNNKYPATTNAIVNEDQYLGITKKLRLDSLKADLSMDRYKSMILILEDEHAQKRFGEYRYYFLGEAYRRRGEKGDDEKSARAYQKAIDQNPEYAQGYRALGMYYLKNKNYPKARTHFEKYLQLTEDPQNAVYVKEYLKRIRQKGY